MIVNAEHIAHRRAYAMDESKYSVLQKIAALRRELALRHNVYPNRVRDRKMKQADADMQIQIFEEILADYERLANGEH